jgi:NADPH:quinone reductase-like Zn-dependent oxidoreductase
MSYKKVIITEFGSPDVLRMVEEPSLPEPKEGEVRIKVITAGAAFTDTMIRKGKYPDVKDKPPFSPGYDLVGTIDALGSGVAEYKKGQMVADLTVIGSYSEYICLPADRLTTVPDGVDPVEAVSLILSYVTAYQMLHRVAKIRGKQSILVHGAGGAVGTAMLQLGKSLGLKIYGTASKSKHNLVSKLGAIPIDYKIENWPDQILQHNGSGLDAVFDPIGGESYKKSFRILKNGGILVGYGFYNAVSGKGGSILIDFLRIKLWNLLPNGKSSSFFSIGDLRKRNPEWFKEDLAALFKLLLEGKIKPVVGKCLPLSDARLAHELIEKAEVQGKLVLKIGEISA